MMNCVIIDDEPLAREGLANYVGEVDFLRLTGSCTNPLELITLLDQQPVDLIFLDIQMPKMNGIDFLKRMPKLPMVILTTAYPSFALEGFQLNVLDYLLKPITFDSFVQSASKARAYQRLLTQPNSDNTPRPDLDYVFIKSGSKYEKIYIADILFIEGMQNYVTIVTDKAKYIALLNLKDLEQELGRPAFIRVHKSYLVAARKIDGIEDNELFIQTHRIPLSRHYRDSVISEVLRDKLWKK